MLKAERKHIVLVYIYYQLYTYLPEYFTGRNRDKNSIILCTAVVYIRDDQPAARLGKFCSMPDLSNFCNIKYHT